MNDIAGMFFRRAAERVENATITGAIQGLMKELKVRLMDPDAWR